MLYDSGEAAHLQPRHLFTSVFYFENPSTVKESKTSVVFYELQHFCKQKKS